MVTKKRGLGRGLSALIPDEPLEEFLNVESDIDSVVNIDINLIKPNKNQPRKEFDSESLKELADSIKIYGVIQPIIVRKNGEYYEIVAGERRWKASKKAGLREIPCLVKDIEEFESMKMALIENIHREDLNPIEEGKAFKELMDKYDLTQEEVSQVVGKSRSYIANSIRLLKLDDETLSQIEHGNISSGHGRALLSINDETERKELAKDIVEKKLNVRETEKIVQNIKANRKPRTPKVDPIIIEVEENLMKYLGTKVKISSGKDKGKIEIEYYSEEDLQRILEVIMKQ